MMPIFSKGMSWTPLCWMYTIGSLLWDCATRVSRLVGVRFVLIALGCGWVIRQGWLWWSARRAEHRLHRERENLEAAYRRVQSERQQIEERCRQFRALHGAEREHDLGNEIKESEVISALYGVRRGEVANREYVEEAVASWQRIVHRMISSLEGLLRMEGISSLRRSTIVECIELLRRDCRHRELISHVTFLDSQGEG